MKNKFEEEENFENYLMGKYPNLFPKDENGDPKSPDCGVSCPTGWRDLVDNLLAAIDSYVANNEKYKQTNKIRHEIWSWIFHKSKICRALDHISKSIDPVDWSDRRFLPSSEVDIIRNSKPFQTWIWKKVVGLKSSIYPKYKWKKTPIPKVTILQSKEKFANLRLYYDGGDDVVAGMVRLAEELSSKTCEITGEKGVLCKRGGLYKTLSEDKAKEHEYEIYTEKTKWVDI